MHIFISRVLLSDVQDIDIAFGVLFFVVLSETINNNPLKNCFFFSIFYDVTFGLIATAGGFVQDTAYFPTQFAP